jgi:cyclopropane-fatty-acyl-phospholipid synthase
MSRYNDSAPCSIVSRTTNVREVSFRMTFTQLGIEAIEHGLVPDAVTRMAIRRLCRERLRELRHDRGSMNNSVHAAFFESMRSGPIAILPEMANQQHYELPPEFFVAVLGPRRKYSCCYFPSDSTTLLEAEEAALVLTCERAHIADGQQILELGCGWGSLTLWMAERFSHSRITAVSNSTSQRQFIEAEARSRGLTNLCVITCDMNDFAPGAQTFDRIVSVEMFEHMRNYDCLLQRIASWLRPEGKLFVHIFCHRELTYPFETNGTANWMGRHFFTGGIMPSVDLLNQFNHSLTVSKQFSWSGRHYQRTAEEWLANLDARRDEILPMLASVYDGANARRWLNRWRMFFLAVSELFGYADGDEWFVSHYVMKHRAAA